MSRLCKHNFLDLHYRVQFLQVFLNRESFKTVFLFLFCSFPFNCRLYWKKDFHDGTAHELSGNEPPTVGSPKHDLRDLVCVSCALTEMQLHHNVAFAASRPCSQPEWKSSGSSRRSLHTGYYVTPRVFMIRKLLKCIVKCNVNLWNVRLLIFFSLFNDLLTQIDKKKVK